MEWICSVCGYVYEGEDFNKEEDSFICPLCDAHKDEFKYRDYNNEVKEASKEL